MQSQVTDALEGLRLALGEKSLCFRTEVRNANSQWTTHRAWIMFISLMLMLESIDLHTDRLETRFSVY